jgi:hypothetical protein
MSAIVPDRSQIKDSNFDPCVLSFTHFGNRLKVPCCRLGQEPEVAAR